MGFSIETVMREGQPDPLPQIVAALNKRFDQIRQANPNGFLDEFESRIETLCVEVGLEMGAEVEIKLDSVLFNVSGVKLRKPREV